MGGHRADEARIVIDPGRAGVGRPTVGLGGGGRGDIGGDKGMQAAGGEVLDCGQTDAAGSGTDDLDGAGAAQLSVMTHDTRESADGYKML